ncbi:MAG: sensor histidine kinase [Fusobacteriaceae bacterium]
MVNTNYASEKLIVRTKETLENNAKILGEILKIKDVTNYHELLNPLNVRYTILNTDGEVIYDSKNYLNEKNMENHLYRPEIEGLNTSETGFNLRNSKTLGGKMAYYAIKINDFQGKKLLIRTSQSYSSQQKEIYILLFLQVMFFLILNGIIMVNYINYLKRSTIKRIEKMRIFLESGIELKGSYLTEDVWLQKFWYVMREWQVRNLDNIARLNQDKNLLNRLINSLDEGIILFNKDLEVVTKNSAMKFLFEKRGKKYMEVIKYIEIIELLKYSYENKTDIEKEIYISNLEKYFYVVIKHLSDSSQYIVTIKKVSIEKEMINKQKKFISDVGHELKTPLTNIKGYLIALEDAPKAMEKNFLNIIKNNVNKMENIVKDFLIVSKLESKLKIEKKSISIRNLKIEIESSLNSIISKKNGKIEYEVKDEVEEICSDGDKVVMILKNLIENGFIYNRNELPSVKINIGQNKKSYVFKVRDNGIGIPSEKIINIFDRFYRVDEARTSNIAGTGLGLSIVKESVKHLGGEIKVNSKLGEFTEFEFTIKKML